MKLKEEDLKEITRLSDEGYGSAKISTMYSLNKSTINRILRRYKKHGIEGIVHRKSKTFSIEQKIILINRYYKGESKSALALEMNVCVGVVQQWMAKYEQLGYNGLIDNRGKPGYTKMGWPKKNNEIYTDTPITNKKEPLNESERIELNELRKRIQQQQMEIDCLKKLQALVQERQNQQTKKKR